MRIKAPQPLTACFTGPEGPYSFRFTPNEGDWDGLAEVDIAGTPLRWSVERIDRDEEGQLVLSGMTSTKDIWNDSFWFEAIVEPRPGRITYWGNQVIWRTDSGTQLQYPLPTPS